MLRASSENYFMFPQQMKSQDRNGIYWGSDGTYVWILSQRTNVLYPFLQWSNSIRFCTASRRL